MAGYPANQRFPKTIPRIGVYAISCRVDGRIYVGQSKNIRGRWVDHVCDLKNSVASPRLQVAWDRYGAENFEFCVLETVGDIAKLSEREQFFIDSLGAHKNGFNVCPKVGVAGGYIPDAITRARIGFHSAHRSPETLEKMRLAKLGKKVGPRSAETKAKMSAAQAKPRGPMSPEHKAAISRALAGRPHSWSRAGCPQTEETKEKIGAANRGKTHPEEAARRKGVKRSPQAIEAMRKARRGLPWSPARREAYEKTKNERRFPTSV